MDELTRELWEIDANLCRVELTELERGEHLAARNKFTSSYIRGRVNMFLAPWLPMRGWGEETQRTICPLPPSLSTLRPRLV
jgi:hypothetical protein